MFCFLREINGFGSGFKKELLVELPLQRELNFRKRSRSWLSLLPNNWLPNRKEEELRNVFCCRKPMITCLFRPEYLLCVMKILCIYALFFCSCAFFSTSLSHSKRTSLKRKLSPEYLVGGFNPFRKICSSNWKSSPSN